MRVFVMVDRDKYSQLVSSKPKQLQYDNTSSKYIMKMFTDIMRAFVVLSNGKNGTIGRQISVQGFTNGTIGNVIGTNGTNVIGTNVTNMRQQMMQTDYSVGNSTNAGKVT